MTDSLSVTFTLYNSLKNIDSTQSVTESWADVVRRLTTHERVLSKGSAAGFGPYVLQKPRVPCAKHRDGYTRTDPHRCDACVQSITLAVFDADEGTQEQIDECRKRLEQDAVAHLWYSSYSYNQAVREGSQKLPYRLVIPLSEPVAPAAWASFRKVVAERYQVPCDLAKCGGKSHFYYVPTCPHWGAPHAWSFAGKPLQVSEAMKWRPATMTTALIELPPDYTPPPDPDEITEETLEPHRQKLFARYTSLIKADGVVPRKAEWLRKCLDGEPLAAKGARNNAATVVAGMLAYNTDGASLGELRAIMAPSVQAMMDEGSSITWAEVNRLLLSAMRNRFIEQEANRRFLDAYKAGLQRKLASLPVYDPRAQ